MIRVMPDGPIPARVMIVGEAPGEDEERTGRPFCGVSGHELDRMLQEAGILRSECFVTNVARERPPRNDINFWLRDKQFKGNLLKEDEKKIAVGVHPATFVRMRDQWVDPRIAEGFELLKKEIQLVRPNLIIALGNLSMWALTGKWAITKWRASMLETDALIPGRSDEGHSGTAPVPWRVIPTYHPAAVLRQWEWRAVTVTDFRRAAKYIDGTAFPVPKWNFILRPTYEQAISCLDDLISRADSGGGLRISHDIETRSGHIACIGLSWSRTDAICLPLMCVERDEGYWSLEQEVEIRLRVRRLLTHPKVEVIGQNHAYDSQYDYRWDFFVPNLKIDTMIGQHSIFSDLPKALYFLASMYNEYYVYWKDEGKTWDRKTGEDQLWHYCCLDCVHTYEVAEVLVEVAKQLGLEEVFWFQQRMHWPVLKAMLRGIRVDKKRRQEMILEVQYEIDRRQAFLHKILGFELNVDSPKQMHTLFYSDFKMPVQMKRGKKGEPSKPTLEDDALQKLVRLEPLLKPLVNSIADIRTLRKFLSNFLCRSLDVDGRMRCSINIGGSESGKSAPKTYRLSTSEDAFGSGTNMQNIPSEKSKSVGKAKARGGIQGIGDPYDFPNIREIFIPDPGYTWFDMDLERADLYVFVWDINDPLYKEFLLKGVDAHLFHAMMLVGKEPPPLDELCEKHPQYKEHRAAYKHSREFAKVFTHAVDYVGGSVTIAKAVGKTVHEVDRARRKYLAMHPMIEPYWKDVEKQLKSRRYVENKFGYRWYVWGRLDQALSEAVAWTPQSTVSIVINKTWERIDRELPEVQILTQVHDSLPGQFPTRHAQTLLPQIEECAKIVVPYDDPLIIPISIKTSEISWGHC